MQAAESESAARLALEAPPSVAAAAADMRGKHRILADLKRLDQEKRSLEEELEALEQTRNVSAICQELLLRIESNPDPLLSVTSGPADPLWDRWFEGLPDSHGCRCWIL